PGDRRAAGAVGTGTDDRASRRYPINHDIEEAPDERAEDCRCNREEPGKLGVEGGVVERHGWVAGRPDSAGSADPGWGWRRLDATLARGGHGGRIPRRSV